MQFKFDADQEYQRRAIDAATALFEGQARASVGVTFSLMGQATVPNRIDLTEQQLIANLAAVQSHNGIDADTDLAYIAEEVETAMGRRPVRFPNFSVEMETGTGKTYVYLRTALELFRRHALRKFIIVVPSVAIREGVLKTLEITSDHFRELYANTPYRYYVYDADSISQVRQFALSDSVEFLIMTIDSFNKASNVIRRSTDRLQGETPIHLIQGTRPVLVLDEPQNMESELRVKALSALDPLFALRYSATHRNHYNLLYRLTPAEAYRQGLVKRIEIASVLKADDYNQVFLRLDAIKSTRRTVTARIAIHKQMKNGTAKETVVTVKPGTSLAVLSNRNDYEGFEVDEISRRDGLVRFKNDAELKLGESQGADKDAIFDAQIRFTVAEHFRKQARLRADGIKVLSLFFIDRVANYAPESGLIRSLFTKAFDQLKRDWPEWKTTDAASVQGAYFAQRRRKGGREELVDSTTGKNKDDERAYDLIMRAKEQLLSFGEPTAFIFTHSALREGWDNPNVFQICTLHQSASEIKKRQEIGRGVRLAVDQTGARISDERVNVLTVVANESYERYVARLQAEIEEEYGREGLPPKPVDARKRGVARLRKHYLLKPEFRELWKRIRHKTRYAVKIDSAQLIREVVQTIDKESIPSPRVVITKAEVHLDADDAFEALRASAARTVAELAGRYPFPNVVDIMSALMEFTTPPVRLTRKTLLEIFNGISDKKAAINNPREFAVVAVRIIKDKLADHLVSGIEYEKIDQWYEMRLFDPQIDGWVDHFAPANHSLYDHIVYQSEPERQFIEGLEKRKDVRLYVKLPSWFKVATPAGDYNPDWAIVMEDRDEHGDSRGPLLYLVRETKSKNWKTDLRPDEARKIECGERHFRGALGVNYRVITNVDELP